MRRAVLLLLTVLAATTLPACTGDDPSYELSAVFERGVSLYAGSQVKVLGLPAGTITSVEVEGAAVRVVMQIDGDVTIPETAVAAIVPASLIGERYVQLAPAWTTGAAVMAPGTEIPLERTSIPVEPDEALAALKEFLDALDPDAAGRLVRNLADGLQGNGATVNRAIEELADLTGTLAAKSDELGGLVDNFDRLTTTLVTREQRIGEALRDFAVLTETLAEERASIERLLSGLGSLSRDGLDLVSAHRAALDRDLEILTRTLSLVDANLDNVGRLLDATPLLLGGPDYSGRESGLIRAVDPEYHRVDLRNNASPLLSSILDPVGLPVQPICIPLDTTCESGGAGTAAPRHPDAAAGASAVEPGGSSVLPAGQDLVATPSGVLRPGQRAVPGVAQPDRSVLARLRGLARLLVRAVA